MAKKKTTTTFEIVAVYVLTADGGMLELSPQGEYWGLVFPETTKLSSHAVVIDVTGTARLHPLNNAADYTLTRGDSLQLRFND